MATVLITGGTGMIGQALTAMLVDKGYRVIILSRTAKQPAGSSVTYAHWDVEKGTIDKTALEQADFIVHLAGANIGEKRWTKKRKQQIVESRTKSSELLVKSLSGTGNKVKAFIAASAIGWYGPDTKTTLQKGFTEDAPAYEDFLGQTCLEWEESTKPLAGKTRLVYLRTGIVLSNKGGALPEFKKSLKFGMAAILGSGSQVISWIHIEDLCRMYLYAVEHELSGVYNAVAPRPVTNKALTLQLARIERGKSYLTMHVPAFVLKIILGEMSIEVLKSTTVNSDKIRLAGFRFLYPAIDAALNDLSNNKDKDNA